MLEKIIPGSKTKLRIIRTIYENPGLNLTALIKKVSSSPNRTLDYINKLNIYKVIKEERLGGKRKTHIRRLFPNLKSELGKLIFSIIEADKRYLLYIKYKFLKNYFKELEDLCDQQIKFILIYGSYARIAATKESDIDLLIIGKLTQEKIKRIKELFITLEMELSIKIETEKKFIQNIKKPLYQNIIKEHVIVCNEMNFIEILSKITAS